jgi:hypothetical protein
MVPQPSPNFSNQIQASPASLLARRIHLNSLLCVPRLTQYPDTYTPPGSQWVLPGTAPELYMQYSGPPPIGFQSLPQPLQVIDRVPEHLMTRFQVEGPPSLEDTVYPAQLLELFPELIAAEVALDGSIMSPNDHGGHVFRLGSYPSDPIPCFGGVERMGTAHHPRSLGSFGETVLDTCGVGAERVIKRKHAISPDFWPRK